MHRQLGNPTDKAWISGWDAGVVGQPKNKNPYRRKPQANAWERGRESALRSSAQDVANLRRRLQTQ